MLRCITALHINESSEADLFNVFYFFSVMYLCMVFFFFLKHSNIITVKLNVAFFMSGSECVELILCVYASFLLKNITTTCAYCVHFKSQTSRTQRCWCELNWTYGEHVRAKYFHKSVHGFIFDIFRVRVKNHFQLLFY